MLELSSNQRKQMTITEIINEGLRLGQEKVGTSKVQARRLELNLTDEEANHLWENFHFARGLAFQN